MTGIAPRVKEWWTRPEIILPVVACVAIIVALLTPQTTQGRFGDQRTSSHLSGSLGARLLADMAGRMGWRIVRRDTEPMPVATHGHTVHALLAPVEYVTPEVAHRYLEAVRNGDALLLALDQRNALTDSLGVTHYTTGSYLAGAGSESGECGGRVDLTPPLWPDGRVHLWGVRWLRGSPAAQMVFARLDNDAGAVATSAATGFPLGRGRIVVVSDADLVRNDVIRRCAWGVDVINAKILEWLRAGGEVPRTTLAFDEYHQGYGSRQGVGQLAAKFLFTHPVGRVILQTIVAGLLLLLALAPRALPPLRVERVERRDPLEQVDALAHAYEQVNGTRTIVSRLLRGVRARVDIGAVNRARSDESFLASAAVTDRALEADVASVQHALLERVRDNELVEAGAALRRIEQTLTRRGT